MKKMNKSRENSSFLGVIGAIADYFKIDSTVLRLAFLFLLVFTGFFPGATFYLLAALIIPRK